MPWFAPGNVCWGGERAASARGGRGASLCTHPCSHLLEALGVFLLHFWDAEPSLSLVLVAPLRFSWGASTGRGPVGCPWSCCVLPTAPLLLGPVRPWQLCQLLPRQPSVNTHFKPNFLSKQGGRAGAHIRPL